MDEQSQQLQSALARVSQLERALERRERQIGVLRRVDEALFGWPDSDVLLAQVLEVAVEMLPARVGSLQIYDAEPDELVVICVAGSGSQSLTGRRMPASQGIAGQVLRTGALDISLHAGEHGGANFLAGEAGDTLITAPLKRATGQCLGVLQLLNAGPINAAKFDPGDLEFFRVLGAAAAAAIEMARLTKRARQSEVVNIIGDISHDIKNMLTPIQSGLWTLEPMLEELFAELEVLREQSHGRVAEQEIQRITSPVRELYSWIFQGALGACDQVTARTREIADAIKGEVAAPFVEESDLNEVIGEVVRPLLMVADRANVQIHLELDEFLPRAEFDRKQMYNAVYNLVNNAIPETPAGGSITIRTQRLKAGGDSEQLLLEVQDTGRGIPENVRAKLFTADAISTKAGGTGLGTRIVAGVVRRHNGTIAVQSQPGRGSTFTIHLPLRYRSQIVESLAESGPLPARRHNLPASATSFVGRERERNLGRAALSRTATRLLSLVGPAGAGKTRLAVQIAGEMLDDFPEGVWFVSLAPLEATEGPGRVAAAISSTLGVRDEPGQSPADTLLDWLRPRQLLLVLDNFEQLLVAAPLVSDLLAACGGLKVLVTSRSPLHLRGERELTVSPLEVPVLASIAARPTPHQLEELKHCAVIALFVERAAEVRPEFVLTPENARDVAEICARLDGLPLAIELAAAHMKTLSSAALRARLENHLPLPEQGPQDAPLRHQTLRAALDWSYNLLTDAEQQLLRRLMVFEGGCSPQSAQAIAGEAGAETPTRLSQLADKSLLHCEERPDGGTWFFPLQTVREYGLDKLKQNGELDALRQRHAHHYLALAETALAQNSADSATPAPPLGYPAPDASPAVWRDWRERERDNIHAAMRWFLENSGQNADDPALQHGALRLALRLKDIWRGGMWSQRREALEAGLQAEPDAPDHMRMIAMLFLGDLAGLQADYERAAEWGQKSLNLSRVCNSGWGTGRALGILAKVALEAGDLERARSLYEQSLALQRELDNVGSVSWALYFLGTVATRAGDAVLARDWFEQSLAAFQQTSDAEGTAFALYELGMNLYDRADPEPARRMLDDSLSTFREQGHKAGVAFVLAYLGQVAADEGNFALAREQFQECLGILRQLGQRTQLCEALQALGEIALKEGNLAEARMLWREAATLGRSLKKLSFQRTLLHSFARLAAAQGQWERAARLLGAAQTPSQIADENRAAEQKNDLKAAHDLAILEVRGVLGETVFAAAREQGRLMSHEDALNEALQI